MHRTYGWYRLEILASLANTALLFGVAGYVMYEADPAAAGRTRGVHHPDDRGRDHRPAHQPDLLPTAPGRCEGEPQPARRLPRGRRRRRRLGRSPRRRRHHRRHLLVLGRLGHRHRHRPVHPSRAPTASAASRSASWSSPHPHTSTSTTSPATSSSSTRSSEVHDLHVLDHHLRHGRRQRPPRRSNPAPTPTPCSTRPATSSATTTTSPTPPSRSSPPTTKAARKCSGDRPGVRCDGGARRPCPSKTSSGRSRCPPGRTGACTPRAPSRTSQPAVRPSPSTARWWPAWARSSSPQSARTSELGLIDPRRADAIERACQDVRDGLLDDQFVVDVLQGGAGRRRT